MGVRRNQNRFSDADKTRYVAAVKRMKTMPGTSVAGRTYNAYDKFVAWHKTSGDYMEMTGGGMRQNHPHRNPHFFPWHRYFLALFERDLQAADRALGRDGSITLPYWDWEHDQASGGQKKDHQRGALWRDNFMGAFKGSDWVFALEDNGLTSLSRTFSGSLPTVESVREAMDQTSYDLSPWDDTDSLRGFRNIMEGWFHGPRNHNLVHLWVGGAMLPFTSPNDPVFFLHHCNVDRIWARWQALHPTATFPTARAAFSDPVTNGPQPGFGIDDPMWPWDGATAPGPIVRPRDVLNHRAMTIGGTDHSHSYDTEPPIASSGP